LRKYLTRLLAPLYEVQAVGDGEAALAMVRSQPPDLVLSDLLMPGLDGFQLLKELRDDPRTHAVPLVLLSAQAGEEAVIEGLSGGADDYLRKPFSARELLARVHSHLELARVRREVAESRMKDAFLGIASHELRTPLTSLKLAIQYLQRQYGSSSSPLSSRLAILNRSITRMEVLTEDMLCVSAIQSGQLTLRPRRHDLVAVCRMGAEEQDLLSGQPIVLDLPAEPIEAIVDEVRLLQVVTNLLSNARKYSRPTGLWSSLCAVGATKRSSRSATRGRAFPATICRTSSNASTAFPESRCRAARRPGLGWGCTSARRSWSSTAGASGSRPRRAGAAPSASPCRSICR